MLSLSEREPYASLKRYKRDGSLQKSMVYYKRIKTLPKNKMIQLKIIFSFSHERESFLGVEHAVLRNKLMGQVKC